MAKRPEMDVAIKFDRWARAFVVKMVERGKGALDAHTAILSEDDLLVLEQQIIEARSNRRAESP